MSIEHTYKIRKGNIELETNDKDLILRILGFEEEKTTLPRGTIVPPKEEEIRETKSLYHLKSCGVVSKACVEEVFKAIVESGKPYCFPEELAPLKEKYNRAYVGRAIHLLKLKGLIQSYRIGKKVAYQSTVRKRAVTSPIRILDKESKVAATRASNESKIQEKIIHEGMK